MRLQLIALAVVAPLVAATMRAPLAHADPPADEVSATVRLYADDDRLNVYRVVYGSEIGGWATASGKGAPGTRSASAIGCSARARTAGPRSRRPWRSSTRRATATAKASPRAISA